MKKNLLLIGLMLALSLTASAQYRGFAFGFKVGPSFDWTGSKTGAAVNQGVKTGCDLGLVAEYYFAENYAIVTGVNVNFLKGHYSFEDMRNISTIDTVTDYQLGTIDRQFKTTVQLNADNSVLLLCDFRSCARHDLVSFQFQTEKLISLS